jgi:hypothetical protein
MRSAMSEVMSANQFSEYDARIAIGHADAFLSGS